MTPIPLAKLADVHLPTQIDHVRRAASLSYYVRHPVTSGVQPMLLVQEASGQLHMLDFLTVLPANAPLVKEPQKTASKLQKWSERKELVIVDSLLSAAFRLIEGVYDFDIRNYDPNALFFSIGEDVCKPPFRSVEDRKLSCALHELLDAEPERQRAPLPPRLRRPILHKNHLIPAELLQRVKLAKDRHPSAARVLRSVLIRLQLWTPYNIQEGRVARSKEWAKEWRIFTLWDKWETDDATWIARLLEHQPQAAALSSKARKSVANSLAHFCAERGLSPARRKRKF